MKIRAMFVQAVVAVAAVASVAWATAPTGKFNAGTDTVVDTATLRTWQRTVDASKLKWQQANDLCGNLTLAGQDDWRLPTVQELYSLVDFSVGGTTPYIDGTAFPAAPFGMFWSATPTPSFFSNSQAYTVSFGGNYGPTVALSPKDTPLAHVRCVR